MRAGLENKRNVAVLVVLLVVLAGALVYFFESVFGGGSAPPAAANHAAVATQGGAAGPSAKKLPSLENLDPTLHPEWMAEAESLKYTGNGRNIFSMESAPPQKIEAAKAPARPTETVAAKTGPPPPPPISLTFFGFEAADGVKKAFLLHGQDVFIAKEGDVVDHHYKILRINPVSVEVMDLLYNNTQTLPLVQS